MTTLALPLSAVPVLVLVVLAVDRWLHAARTRRQIVDVLAAVPEVAGVAPAAYGERVGELAAALARAEGLTGGQVARVAAAARLLRLGEVASRAPIGACTRVAAAAGVRPDVLALLDGRAVGAPGRGEPGGGDRAGGHLLRDPSGGRPLGVVRRPVRHRGGARPWRGAASSRDACPFCQRSPCIGLTGAGKTAQSGENG